MHLDPRTLPALVLATLSALLLACEARVSVAPLPEPPSTYSAAAFYETTHYRMGRSSRAFSPAGDRLLLSSDRSGIFNAYALDLATGEEEALTASASDSVAAIGWLPDGERFLYSSDRGGDERTHVYLAGAGGEARDLTPGAETKASFVAWLGEGEAFVLATNERDPKAFDLYRYASENGSRRLLWRNAQALDQLAVSRDGRFAAGREAQGSADSDLYLIRLDSPEARPRLVTPHEGEVSHEVFGFTPESDALVYGSDEGGEFRRAWAHALEGGEKGVLIVEDWDVEGVAYSPSGRYRVHLVNEDGAMRARLFDRQRGAAVALPPELPAGPIGSLRFSPDETRMAFLLDSDTSARNVYTLEIARGELRRRTRALAPGIDPSRLVAGEVIRYPSFDGLEIPGILYRPRGAGDDAPAPALVWVHGGPGGQSGLGYAAQIQYLVHHGYAVLAANNRGSSGYGKTFFHLDDRRHGEVDLADIVHARRYLEGLDWVDGERIGIIGGSYGGYMVMAALAFEPEVFDVGVNIFGVTNWVRTLESIPPWWESFRDALYDELGDPATDGERLRRISPLFHAERVTKPLLVVQGANDPRVLQVESDEIVAAVRAGGTPVEYLLFPDEGHGFEKRENRIRASEAYLRFLDTYLRGAPKGAPAAG